MDISVLASVGSFVVSERVLKPKASVLLILGCVLAYDLTSKTHDSSSLRVYRGPGLLAFCLMMVAYSLRTWRRNGIACDELLFLPGTPHGESTTTLSSSGNGGSGGGGGGNESSSVMSGNQNSIPQATHSSSSSSPLHSNNAVIPTTTTSSSHSVPMRSEGDVAAGGSWVNTTTTTTTTTTNNNTSNSQPPPPPPHTASTTETATTIPPSNLITSHMNDPSSSTATTTTMQQHNTHIGIQRSFSQRSSRARSLSHDSSLSSIHEFVNNWEVEDEDLTDDIGTNHHHHHLRNSNNNNDNDDDDDNDETHLMIPLTSSVDTGDVQRTNTTTVGNTLQQQQHITSSDTQNHLNINTNNNNNHSHHNTRAERFRDNHPNVTRIGSFFFFRSSTSSTHNAAYAPSGPSVVGAAIDLSMPVLFNFHLFIEAWNHMDSYNSNTTNSNSSSNDDDNDTQHHSSSNDPGSSISNTISGGDASAKILPLIFLSVLIVRSFFPPGRRGRFWSTIKITALAPYYRSRFRDCYIGDVLTSLVRPFQDIVFALAYYVTVIWGSITSKYNLSESGHILERSWVLHNVFLPTIALLPLWWKFLQTLRESYDTGKRWPYLGNAFKYLTAAIVILYGMTHPEDRRSVWWIVSFGLTLAYQIFWDTIMDWDLFVIAPKEIYGDTNNSLDISESTMWFNRPMSSMRSESYWSVWIQRILLPPIRECIRVWSIRCPSYKQIQIRPRRLYKSELFYWRIFFYNSIFRFCWMLSFIPAYHFSSSGRDVITTFSSDTNSYVGVLLPIAEILRRTLWGFLYLEMRTIKMSDGEPCHQLYTSIDSNNIGGGSDNNIEMSSLLPDSSNKHNGGPSRFPSSQQQHSYVPAWLGMQQQLQHDAATTTAIPSSSVSTTTTTTTTTTSNINTAASNSTSKMFSSGSTGGSWFQFNDRIRHKLFTIELTLWAIAFVGFGIWATL